MDAEPETATTESAIIGGVTDYGRNYPWQVDVTNNGGLGICPGVLVAPTWVLTNYLCTGAGGTIAISYQRTDAGGLAYSDSQTVTHLYVNGSVALLQIGTPLWDPVGFLVPAALPTVDPVVGQSGTVVSGHPSYGTVNVSSPQVISGVSTNTFTAHASSSSVCLSDRGAGFIVSVGNRNVVLGIVSTTGSCSANNETLTADNVTPYSAWIQGYTGYWGIFDRWSNANNAKAVSGDFNGDGKADIALAGGDYWSSIPVAFSLGDGHFSVTNAPVSTFPGWANATGAQVVAGDVDGDGKDDLIALGMSNPSGVVPVAFSHGDGTFTTTTATVSNIPGWAQAPGAKLLAGDVNNDGCDDIILTGGGAGIGSGPWTTIPVGFSSCSTAGTFGTVTNIGSVNFPTWANQANVQAVVTDVNADGKADVVLTSGSSWNTEPTARSTGAGAFVISATTEFNISAWSRASGAKALGGCRRSVYSASFPNRQYCDVNGDSRGDILLTAGASWSSIPVGYWDASGNVTNTNATVTAFPGWAQDPGAKAVSGDFDGDHRPDIALVGGSGWWTIPIAYSTSTGAFQWSNHLVD